MKALYEALATHLLIRGSDTTHSHTGSGEPILETPDELGLMIFVEINDQKTGHHETVPLQDLGDRLAQWRTE